MNKFVIFNTYEYYCDDNLGIITSVHRSNTDVMQFIVGDGISEHF